MGISRGQGDSTRPGAHSTSKDGFGVNLLSYKGRSHLHSSFLFCCQLPGTRQAWLCPPQGLPDICQLQVQYSFPIQQHLGRSLQVSTCPMPNRWPRQCVREHTEPPRGHGGKLNFPLPPTTPKSSTQIHPPAWQQAKPASPPTGRQPPPRIEFRTREGPGADGMAGGREKRCFNLALKTRATIDYRQKGQAERDAHQGPQGADLPYLRYSHWDHL